MQKNHIETLRCLHTVEYGWISVWNYTHNLRRNFMISFSRLYTSYVLYMCTLYMCVVTSQHRRAWQMYMIFGGIASNSSVVSTLNIYTIRRTLYCMPNRKCKLFYTKERKKQIKITAHYTRGRLSSPCHNSSYFMITRGEYMEEFMKKIVIFYCVHFDNFTLAYLPYYDYDVPFMHPSYHSTEHKRQRQHVQRTKCNRFNDCDSGVNTGKKCTYERIPKMRRREKKCDGE